MQRTINVILIVVLAAIVSVYVLVRNDRGSERLIEKVGSEKIEAAAVINMTKSGFSPTFVSIRKNQGVRFVNKLPSDCPAPDMTCFFWPASDPHPTHEFYPEFDVREAVGPGESWTFLPVREGSWEDHDHFESSYTATVQVLP